MKNVLFLSSWYPSRVHTTLGNFVRYHALAASKYNSINVLYIVADDNVKDYEIKYFQDHELKTTIVYFKRGIFKYLNYFVAFTKGFHFVKEKNKFIAKFGTLNSERAAFAKSQSINKEILSKVSSI